MAVCATVALQGSRPQATIPCLPPTAFDNQKPDRTTTSLSNHGIPIHFYCSSIPLLGGACAFAPLPCYLHPSRTPGYPASPSRDRPKPAHETTPRSPPATTTMARVYADVNANMPRSYWDYDSVAISWGVLENYEIVRKIGEAPLAQCLCGHATDEAAHRTRKILRGLRRH